PTAARSTGPSIWVVAGADTTIYLMGTAHITSGIGDWQSAAFRDAWAAADAVYVETDVASGNPQQRMQALIPRYGLNTGGATLASFFSEDEVATLDRILAPLNLSIARLAPLRPWLANLQAGLTSMSAAGIDLTQSVDRTIAGMALADDKELRSFETLEAQIELIAAADDKAVARYLLRTADQQWTNAAQYIETLSTAWFTGDDEGIAAIMARDFDGYPDAAERLLYSRNDRWASELTGVMQEERGVFFVAVGVGHLVGDRSLQEQLEQRGFTVDRAR
ncbi:MAG: TraB/GumN family protein, partial [Pseudomonadota bacterium]